MPLQNALLTKPTTARGPAVSGPSDVLPPGLDFDDVLGSASELISELLHGKAVGTVSTTDIVLAPVQSQEVWAAGVTYERSRAARNQESGSPDYYDKVYAAERPELFFSGLSI